MKILGPYIKIYTKYGKKYKAEYVRQFLGHELGYSGAFIFWDKQYNRYQLNYSFNKCSRYFSNDPNKLKQSLDEYLIKNNYILLSQDQFDKLNVLA